MAVSLTLVQRVIVCIFFKPDSLVLSCLSLFHTHRHKKKITFPLHIQAFLLGECVRSWTVGLSPHVKTCVSVYNFNERIKRDYHSGHEKRRNKTKHKE